MPITPTCHPIHGPTPLLGQHTDEVLAELELGEAPHMQPLPVSAAEPERMGPAGA